MPDVILPVLDEAGAIPAVLRGDARRLPGRSSSTTAPATAPAAIAAQLGARVVMSRTAALAPPATPACWRRARRSSASWTATARSTRPSCRGWSALLESGEARARARLRAAPRRVPGRRMRGSPTGARARCCGRAAGSCCVTSARCARAGRAGADRSICATARSASRWRWCCARRRRLADRRAAGRLPAADRGSSKVTGTLRGTVRAVRDMTRLLAYSARRADLRRVARA